MDLFLRNHLLTSVVVKLVELVSYVMHSSRGYRRIGDRHSRRKDCFSFPPGSVQPDSEFIGCYVACHRGAGPGTLFYTFWNHHGLLILEVKDWRIDQIERGV